MTRPRIIRSVVVFPDPFGPRKPVTPPGSTVKSSPATALTGPNCLVRSWTVMRPLPSSTRTGRPNPPRRPTRPGRPRRRGRPRGPPRPTARGRGRWAGRRRRTSVRAAGSRPRRARRAARGGRPPRGRRRCSAAEVRVLHTGGRVAITAPSGSAASSARSRASTPRGLPRTSAVPTTHVTRSAGRWALSATSSGSCRFSTSSMSAPSEARFTTRHGVPSSPRTSATSRTYAASRVLAPRPRLAPSPSTTHSGPPACRASRLAADHSSATAAACIRRADAPGRNAPTNRSPPARTRCRTASACSARSCRVGPIALPSLRRLRRGAAAAPLCPAVVLRVPDRARTPYAPGSARLPATASRSCAATGTSRRRLEGDPQSSPPMSHRAARRRPRVRATPQRACGPHDAITRRRVRPAPSTSAR